MNQELSEVLSRIRRVKTVLVPAWATHIHVLSGSRVIAVPVAEFLAGQSTNQLAHEGVGAEVYASDCDKANTVTRGGRLHLRSRPGRRVKLLGAWVKTHETWLRFEPAPAEVAV